MNIKQLDRKRPAVMPEIIAVFKEDPTVRDRWGDPESRWFLTVDGNDYSELIPDRDDRHEISTKGFVEDWVYDGEDENYTELDEGLDQDEWIEENLEWLSKISMNLRILRKIYEAFQEAEWGENAC